MVYNKCPPWATAKQASMTCVNQTFPAPAYASVSASLSPMASPLLGTTGVSLKGVVVFGPLEAGFIAGQACSVTAGVCNPGMDLTVCEHILHKECGSANVLTSMLPDSCGGHASPYHYHMGLGCEYNVSDAGHSKLAAIMLDGRGLYGAYESTGVLASGLDACNGHYGPVPSTTINGVTYPAEMNVYHYHVTDGAPHTQACYGPVTSMAQAKALYPGCSGANGTYTGCTAAGKVTNMPYWCPPHVTTYNNTDPTCNNTTSAATAASPAGALLFTAAVAAVIGGLAL